MRLVGSERNGTHCRVPGCSESCGISLSSRRNSQGWSSEIVDGRTFFRPRTVASRRRFSALSHPTSDIPSMEFSPGERGGREKLKSVSHYCIAGVARHPVKVKQFAGPYIDDVMSPFSLSLPLFFRLSSFARRSIGFFSRHCGEFSWTHVSPILKLSTR